ncbi:MAG: bifunctional phosphoglucose/phosphomannose isomerase [Acidimicrobiaceae bacterium]|nr:bifunctional phosphoglucose/phosphomannose isomerase [Acidimicrobiaceae bacterium]
MSTRVDTQGMWDVSAGLPEQVAQAAIQANALAGLPLRHQIENIVVLGMGGSGISGDVLLAAAAPFMAVPVTVVKSYNLPAFVSRGTLVFAVSFSGDTEETLEASQLAYEQGAYLVVVTSGGELGKFADESAIPLIRVPSDIPQPRGAIGALSIPPLVVLEDIGLFPGATYWIDLAIAQLRRRRDQLLLSGNPAEVLAGQLFGKIPVMHSAGSIGAAGALRWKAQINENVKSPAFYSVYPENCHNEITGWESLLSVTKESLAIVSLRHDGEHPQVYRRMEIGRKLLSEKVSSYSEFRAEGDGDLAQLFDLIITGDFLSLHLAELAGVDPGPVPILADLKGRLRSEL